MTDSRFSIVPALAALAILPTIAAGEPALSLDSDVSVVQGGTVAVTLSISGGTEPYAGANVRLTLPEGVTMESATAGPLLSPRFVLESRGYTEADLSKTAIVIYSDTDTFGASEGVLVTLTLRAADTAPTGTFAVAFDEGASAISNEGGSESVLHSTIDGSITVSEGGGIVICSPRQTGSWAAGLPDGALLLFLICALVLKKRGHVPFQQ